MDETFIPKYQKVLAQLRQIVEDSTPGNRLPTVRQLMAQYEVSQAAIERCLDELVRDGLVRRERGRGLFVDGAEPRSRMLGLYADGELPSYSNAIFLEGARGAAEAQGFHVADFGSKDALESQQEILAALNSMGFAGIIASLSSSNFFNIEGDRHLTDFLRQIRMPLVTCRPFAAIQADSVTPDYFGAYKTLGEFLRPRLTGPILYLGHMGIPSLARMYGLKAGLGQGVDLRFEILDGQRGEGAYRRLAELKADNWPGSLVIGVPPPSPGEVAALRHMPWQAGSGRELAVTLETTQWLPPGTSAHVIVKPSLKMGEVAANMLIRRVRGFRGEMCHEIVRHDLRLVRPDPINV